MKSSLIVLNYNGVDLLPGCLSSLEKAVQKADHEVIVVDNGSTDGSPDFISHYYPWVKVIARPTNHYIFGLMDGVAAARSNIVLFLNNDIVVEPDFLDPLLSHFSDPAVFGVTSRIKEAKTGLDQGARTAGVYHRGMIHYQIRPHVDYITNTFFAVGGQSAFDRNKLLELGGIDRLYWPMYDEDIDLSYRAWKRGWTVKYEPDSVIHHLGSVTSHRVFTKEQLDTIKAKNRLLLIWKNIHDPRLFRQHLLWLGPRLVRSRQNATSDPLYGGFKAAWRQLNEVRLARKQARYQARLTDHQVLAILKQI